jgi:hypothetical protein
MAEYTGNIVDTMVETQREYINVLLKEKYYLTEENKLLREKNHQHELMIDTMKVKYISYLDDYVKNTIILTDKIKSLQNEMECLKEELEKEKCKNIPVGVRINDLDDDWDDNGRLELDDLNTSVENKEKFVIEYLYNSNERPVDFHTKNVSIETQTDSLEYSDSMNENNKTIFPDFSSILDVSFDNMENSELFELF